MNPKKISEIESLKEEKDYLNELINRQKKVIRKLEKLEKKKRFRRVELRGYNSFAPSNRFAQPLKTLTKPQTELVIERNLIPQPEFVSDPFASLVTRELNEKSGTSTPSATLLSPRFSEEAPMFSEDEEFKKALNVDLVFLD